MAWIKETKTDHLVVGWYRDRRIKTWLCPDLKTFTEFKEATALAKKQRRQVADPATTYGEFARPNVKATKKATADERRAAKLATKTTATPTVMMSAAAWVGDPGGGKPGPYFLPGHAMQMLPNHMNKYETALRLYGSHFSNKPMNTVTHADAVTMMRKMLVCEACVRRARAAKRTDLLKSPWLNFGADQLPFDAACIDDDGESTHFSGPQNATLKTSLVLMKALWKVAKKAGQIDTVAGFAGLTENPFEHIIGAIPKKVAQRVTNDSLSEALSHTRLDLLNASMPEHCESLVLVTAYGLFRRSEVLGLMRVNIEWPTLPEHKGQARIRISKILDNKNQERDWGKTPDATGESISLSKTATDALRAHLVKHRSTPNPACSTCAAGVGEILDSKINNHTDCDFANNAPLWWDTKHNRRLWGENFSNDYFAEACEKAGLTQDKLGWRPTVKLLRATGATLLLDAGVPITDVARMGRWTNIDTLQKHYHRIRDVSKTAAAAALDLDARGELGLSTQDDATLESRVRFQQRRIEVLEGELKETHAQLAANNIDLQALKPAPTPAPTPAPQRVDNWWEDTDKVRAAVAKHSKQSAIIRALSHVTAQHTDYAKLAEVAALHDIELPPLVYRRGRTTEVA